MGLKGLIGSLGAGVCSGTGVCLGAGVCSGTGVCLGAGVCLRVGVVHHLQQKRCLSVEGHCAGNSIPGLFFIYKNCNHSGSIGRWVRSSPVIINVENPERSAENNCSFEENVAVGPSKAVLPHHHSSSRCLLSTTPYIVGCHIISVVASGIDVVFDKDTLCETLRVMIWVKKIKVR